MPVRIVNVITRMIVGGPQQVALLTARYYQDFASVDFHLVFGKTTGREGDYHAEIAASGVPHHPLISLVRELAPVKDIRALGALVALLRRLRPHLVHARSAKARFLAPLAARLARVPVTLQTVHGWSFNNAVDRRRPLFVRLERLARRLCDTTVLVSQQDLAEGLTLGVLPPAAVARGDAVVIRSGVDLGAVAPLDGSARRAFRTAQGVPDTRPVISLVQRLSPPKTPLVFVRALPRILAERPDAVAWVVGDGPLRASVEQAAAEAGLTGRVSFLGLRKDVPDVLSASDVTVHSSLREGLPRVVLEALAVGTPVVATAVGGVPDVLADGVNGLLVPPEDPAALAGAVLATLADPKAAARRAQAGRAALHPFSARQMLQEQHALYRRLLARRGIALAERPA
jgi:glycosyltransferase involved in cell wall biosynthesis